MAFVPDDSGNGRNGDDAALALTAHGEDCGLHDVEESAEVRVEDFVPGFAFHRCEQSIFAYAGVAYDSVVGSVFADVLLDNFAAFLAVADVKLERADFPAFGLDFFDECVYGCRAFVVVGDYGVAGLGSGFGDGASDSAACACDENLSRVVHFALVLRIFQRLIYKDVEICYF